jgi:hypothetical protein
MNRQQRRQAQRLAGKRRHLIFPGEMNQMLTPSGIEVEIAGNQLDKVWRRDPLAGVKPDEHVWVMFMIHRVNPATMTVDQQHFDTESLITVTGPGCFRCELPWTEGAEQTTCAGEPPGQLGYTT